MQKKMSIAKISSPVRQIRGDIFVPGDKSISHRALMFGTLAIGTTTIHNLLRGQDVLHTLYNMQALGATIITDSDMKKVTIQGVGVGGLKEPETMLDFGNAGTGSRLTMGICATHPITSFFTGDASLCGRPMARIMNPLQEFGAKFVSRKQGRMPLAVIGAKNPLGITYQSPVASAQVKSAVLLAGLNSMGETKVIESVKTRDHTEKMMAYFGAKIETVTENNQYIACVSGYPILTGKEVIVPSDPSSAAFPIVAAIITPDSEITVRHILLSPERIGLYTTLQEMGADLTIHNQRLESGEMVGDMTAKSSSLRGIVVPPERAASMIDEYPILAIAASCAKGDTVMRGIEELRVKESDRITAMVQGLARIGAIVTEHPDGMTITGGVLKGNPSSQQPITTYMDHRIAMSFMVAGLVAHNAVVIDDMSFVATSFPDFEGLMNRCGCAIEDV